MTKTLLSIFRMLYYLFIEMPFWGVIIHLTNPFQKPFFDKIAFIALERLKKIALYFETINNKQQ